MRVDFKNLKEGSTIRIIHKGQITSAVIEHVSLQQINAWFWDPTKKLQEIFVQYNFDGNLKYSYCHNQDENKIIGIETI